MLDNGITLKASSGISEERSFRQMPRNRFQKGSIKQVPRADGPWFVLRYHQYIRQTDGSEKRMEKRVPLGPVASIGTLAAANRLARPYLDRVNASSFSFLKTDITFPDFFSVYFENAKLTIEKSTSLTVECYQKSFSKFFARHKLSAMSGDEFQAFVHYLVKNQYAPTTIHNMLQVLKQSWKWAVAKKYPVDRDAFMELKIPPKVRPEQPVFTPEQSFQIIVSDCEPFKTMEWINFETGVRPSELVALSKRSLQFVEQEDLSYCIVSIIETLSPRTGEIRAKGKTRNAMRNQLCSPELTAHLKAYLATISGDYLFTNSDGRPISTFQFYRHLRARCEKLGFKGSPKAFRHGAATVMGSMNTPAAVVTKRLGHCDIEFTRRNYMHAVSSDEFTLARELGKFSKGVN